MAPANTYYKAFFMRKYISILLGGLLLFGCAEQQEPTLNGNEPEIVKLSNQEAQKRFAKLLSKAVYNNADIRSFLKKEALAQFDNDYDVFYPYVKNKIVSNGQTFREILLSYCESEEMYSQMEESSLLLNILVPDLSLFNSFNAENWDVSEKEIAVISKEDKDNTIFEDGEALGSLPLNEIPDFPCLVIKNNERLKISNRATRADGATYEFIADAYNGNLNPQTRHSSYDENVESTEDPGRYIPAADLHPSIIKAWEELKSVKQAFQRDYVYYNINQSNQPGELNRNFRESIYKFRVFPAWVRIIADQSGKDPEFVPEFSQESRYLTSEEIIRKMWIDGKFEINFDFYLGAGQSKGLMRQRLPFSLAASQLWAIEKVHIEHRNSTLLRRSKNTYTIDPEDLKPKWIYPEKLNSNNSVFLQPWDLYTYSTTISLFVTEYDEGQTIEETRSFYNQYVNKLDVGEEIGGQEEGSMKKGIKMGYGYDRLTTDISSTKVNITTETNSMGSLIFYYHDPIIVDDSQKSTKGYKVLGLSAGNSFEAILLPKPIY